MHLIFEPNYFQCGNVPLEGCSLISCDLTTHRALSMVRHVGEAQQPSDSAISSLLGDTEADSFSQCFSVFTVAKNLSGKNSACTFIRMPTFLKLMSRTH